MIDRYYEERSGTEGSSALVSADLVRHFHARQELGKTLIIADENHVINQVRKQWHKLSRDIQTRRGLATNPIAILKYTYVITQMQHMVFSDEVPEYQPDARVFVLQPHQLNQTLIKSPSIYVIGNVSPEFVPSIVDRLAPSGLLVCYTPGFTGQASNMLRPRSELELAAHQAWTQLDDYLKAHSIAADSLVVRDSADAMDDAVDILLANDTAFLSSASQFQRALDLARPLISTPKYTRDRYEAIINLAHRVQTFSSGGFSPRFLHTYSNDDFLLHENTGINTALISEQIQSHLAAGRLNIVTALMGNGGFEPQRI